MLLAPEDFPHSAFYAHFPLKPARIILIRHAESAGNVDKGAYGHTPDYALELSPRGEVQAAAAGPRLRALVGDESVFAYVSPMWRTRRTFEHLAAALAPGQVRWREEPRLREQEWPWLKVWSRSRIWPMRIDKKWLKRHENGPFPVPASLSLAQALTWQKAVPETGLPNQSTV